MVADILTRPTTRRRRGRLVVALVGVAVAALVAAITVSAYVFPATAALPARADVIYVIGPPTEGRIALAEQLRSDGVADEILISVPSEGEQSAAKLSACQEAWVTCGHPEPFTTAGEMALLNSLYGADARAVVITFTPHVSRTRFIAWQCAAAEVTVIDVPTSIAFGQWVYQFAYQTGGFAKALAFPCS
ncbi:YdcF family protein [Microbacterium sp. VKM Ac-2923]|uniref:YdcF family protein n=1 Tax=Microbacterium sp. VKM Ac-2923 TaxID=2929476 RepID=UPI001FB3192C|nr:YdcF family protein [Microbacterium sp. VKM Ac-2923]MCJ1707080.1 YdcF family protein [Microbacterium sp. VKM Ac-2923]